MIDELARLEDALKRQYVNNARQDVREALVVASAPPADLVRRLLDLFPNSRITVIAHEERDLADLREATLSHERVRLVRGGTVDLADLAPAAYDLAIIRQPDITFARAAWEVALGAVARELRSDALLALTTDSVADASFLDEVLRSLSYSMLPGTPYTAVPVAFSGVDRYILLYRRG